MCKGEPKSYTTKGSVYRHLKTEHKLENVAEHYKTCSTWTHIDTMVDDVPTYVGNTTVELERYDMECDMISNDRVWKNVRFYLISHVYDDKGSQIRLCNRTIVGTLELPEITEFKDSIKPFKTVFEYATCQLTNEFTDREFNIIRTMSRVDLDVNYDYSLKNLQTIVNLCFIHL